MTECAECTNERMWKIVADSAKVEVELGMPLGDGRIYGLLGIATYYPTILVVVAMIHTPW